MKYSYVWNSLPFHKLKNIFSVLMFLFRNIQQSIVGSPVSVQMDITGFSQIFFSNRSIEGGKVPGASSPLVGTHHEGLTFVGPLPVVLAA